MTTNLNQAGKILTRNTKKVRVAIELSQDKMSAMTGVSTRTLQRMEAARKANRTYRPMLKTVVKLAEFAGVTVDEYIKHNYEFQ